MSDVLNFNSFTSIDGFIKNSILNDSNYSSGVMRLNRFVGVMDVKKIKDGTIFADFKHNNDVQDYGNDFLAWNIFKINCPALRLGIESKEVDMIPRYYFKSWENDDLEISFIESADMKMRHYFFEWMECALHSVSFVRHYYDDVKSNWFVIYPLNNKGVAERYDIFLDLVPYDINSINFDVSDTGEQTVLTSVKFKYIKHRVLSLKSEYGTDKSVQSESDGSKFGKPTITVG